MESQDLARILYESYVKYCQKQNIQTYPEHTSATSYQFDVRVVKNSIFPLCEHGLHRMIRASPYGNGKIHTSHAKVMVALKEEKVIPQLRLCDVSFEPFKATGPGGQHRNKTLSAIRATHTSGLMVIAAQSRHQAENKQQALIQLQEKWEQGFRTQFLGESAKTWQSQKQLPLVRSYADNRQCVIWKTGHKTRLSDFFKGSMDFTNEQN